MHDEISGNKWRKLQPAISECLKNEHLLLITFGGAYSNHIYATAAACHIAGIASVGVIRGETDDEENPTLAFARERNMKLLPVTRSDFRDKENLTAELSERFPGAFILPEGGTTNAAVQSCMEIIDDRMREFSHVCVAIGTGGTMAGMIIGMQNHGHVLGFSALKGAFPETGIKKLLSPLSAGRMLKNWSVNNDYHQGGYGKINDTLIGYIQTFYLKHGILLDPIYTGKMMFGIHDLILRDKFPPGSSVCAVHTGGLQGWKGVRQRYGVDPTSF